MTPDAIARWGGMNPDLIKRKSDTPELATSNRKYPDHLHSIMSVRLPTWMREYVYENGGAELIRTLIKEHIRGSNGDTHQVQLPAKPPRNRA